MISPPTTAPPGESNPPSTTAGIAASATSPSPGVTPAAGKEARKRPPTAASAPASAHAPAATRLSRMPISPAVSPSSAAERHATRDHARSGDADAGELDYVRAPRRADADDIGADLPRHLRRKQDVDAEREDRQRPEVGGADPADQERVDEQREQRGGGDGDEYRGPEPERVVEAPDQVRPHEQHAALGEVDDAGGAEDRHEAERDQRVDRAEEEAADHKRKELRHPASLRSSPQRTSSALA